MTPEPLLRGRLITLDPNSTNPFQLPDPSKQMCNLYRYRIGLSQLVIEVRQKGEVYNPVFIWFGEVTFFSGPIYWVGADFQPMNQDDVIRIMRQMDQFAGMPDELFPAGKAGIELRTERGMLIQIIAGSFVVWDTFPEWQLGSN